MSPIFDRFRSAVRELRKRRYTVYVDYPVCGVNSYVANFSVVHLARSSVFGKDSRPIYLSIFWRSVLWMTFALFL